jgi:hypothetical protein
MVIFFYNHGFGRRERMKKSGFKGEDIQNWGTRDFFWENPLSNHKGCASHLFNHKPKANKNDI